ncbi:MAG: 4-hydroxy-tetrahydrodipicolinate synthase [Verrucomicrobiales bacterium]|jgi:4-hydroxy-tetrahydrodipicolinate synthase|nr:4-hydroxy-tetrahydrodipicolinate synthase [Verrucomicrobiales bacterium]
MFAGAHTALVTPFSEQGTVDADAFRTIIDRQFENGIRGIVPVGTTGESATLTTEEHRRVIEIAVKQASGKGIVIAGTGSNSTHEAIDLTQSAELAGADAALLVTPYYNKPSQEGLFQHYRAIAGSTELPLMLYSIPGRCHIQIDIETVQRLIAECPNIRAIKEAGGVTERVRQLREALPEEFQILSGDDALTVDFMKEGAVGVVSVASNLIPAAMADLTSAMLEKRIGDAEAIHAKYGDLFSAFLTLDTNPVPIKAALGLTGACLPKLRLPMVEMPSEKVEQLRSILQSLGLV